MNVQERNNLKVVNISRTDILTEQQKEEIHKAKLMKQEYDEDAPAYGYVKLANMLEKTKEYTAPIQERLNKL